MYRSLGESLHHGHHLIIIAEVDPGVDSLSVEVEGESHQVHVARALAVPKEAPLYSITFGQLFHFRGSHSTATVIMGM